MRHLGIRFFLAASTMGFVGCGQFGTSNSTPRGGIAVVDLDKVAAETGRDRLLNQSVKMAEDSLNEALARTGKDAQEKLELKKREFGEEMTDDEKKQYSDIERSVGAQLIQIRDKARAQYVQFRDKELASFRDELKPIAQEVALKRGLSVVIPKNPGLLLAVDPGVDITDDVVKVMKEKHPTPTRNTSLEASRSNQSQESDSATQKTATKRATQSAKSAGSSRSAARDDDRDQTR